MVLDIPGQCLKSGRGASIWPNSSSLMQLLSNMTDVVIIFSVFLFFRGRACWCVSVRWRREEGLYDQQIQKQIPLKNWGKWVNWLWIDFWQDNDFWRNNDRVHANIRQEIPSGGGDACGHLDQVIRSPELLLIASPFSSSGQRLRKSVQTPIILEVCALPWVPPLPLTCDRASFVVGNLLLPKLRKYVRHSCLRTPDLMPWRRA